MLRLAFSALILTACLGGTKALAQQQPAPTAPKPAQTAPASKSAQPATQSVQPAAAQPAPKADAPPASWIAAAAYVDEAESDPVSRSGGQQIAPGFTAAPSHRVTTDYMGRPLSKPFKRVRRVDAQPAPAPAPATNTLGNQAAPQKTAPAKETQSGTSDW